MKIAIFGAGALGGYFGARLVEAGHDVCFIARGAHLDAIKRDGLKIESPLGDAHIDNVAASDNPTDFGPVDLVFFLVKLYDTETAARSLAPLLHENTAVISFQNGINGWQRLGDEIGAHHVIGGIAYIFADVKSPGVIRHSSQIAKLVFGEFNKEQSERSELIQNTLKMAGIDSELVRDIDVQIWKKFVLLSSLSGVTTLTRLPIGAILEDAHAKSLFRDALEECTAVGLTQCSDLPRDIAQTQMSFASNLPYDMHASMLDDLNRGKRLEINDLSGAVVRLGKEQNIETPVHSAIHRALHPYAEGI